MDASQQIEIEIVTELDRLATEEQIQILYACESGSRAWGFPSPDSDYDVRFIYLRPLDWYLAIDDRRDTIDLPVNSILDINGWDLRKALKLFKGSNSAIYEWLQSPIIYRSSSNLSQELMELAAVYYSPRAGIHHYLNMTTNCYQQDLQAERVKLKKYFYALRPILAARWIVERRTHPPMTFDRLRELISDRQDLSTEIDRLLATKATANEATTIAPSPIVNDFLRSEIEWCELAVKDIPKHHTDSLAIDNLFRDYVLDSAWRTRCDRYPQ